jgi:hypothetical protein
VRECVRVCVCLREREKERGGVAKSFISRGCFMPCGNITGFAWGLVQDLQVPGAVVAHVGKDIPPSGCELIGMSCWYPVEAKGTDAFWCTVSGGKDVQGVVPYGRWDIDAVYSPEIVPGRLAMYTRCVHRGGASVLSRCLFGLFLPLSCSVGVVRCL